MKKCPTCKTEKPLDQFHKDRSKPDGLNLYCKPCTIAKQKVFQSKPPRHIDAPGTKTCRQCKHVKTPEDFYAWSGTWDGRQKICKVCSGERYDLWRRKNLNRMAEHSRKGRAAHPERFKDYALKHNYGIDRGTYDVMLAAQNGQCAICATTDTGRHTRFHVDHCHDTGKIRGLLCHGCNVSLGHFKHSTKVTRAATSYLEKHNGPNSTA